MRICVVCERAYVRALTLNELLRLLIERDRTNLRVTLKIEIYMGQFVTSDQLISSLM